MLTLKQAMEATYELMTYSRLDSYTREYGNVIVCNTYYNENELGVCSIRFKIDKNTKKFINFKLVSNDGVSGIWSREELVNEFGEETVSQGEKALTTIANVTITLQNKAKAVA